MKTKGFVPWLRLCSVLAAGIVGPEFSQAGTVLDSNFSESVLWSDPISQGNTTTLAWAPDGSNRLFLARRNGRLRIIKNGVLLAAPFVTLSPIDTTGECGLLGICFDPDFVNNHYLYLFVTVSGVHQIIRYTVSGDLGINKTVILSGLPAQPMHDGGGIGIGWDGKIYCSIGDNGNTTGVNSDLTSMSSKVIRLNRDGSIPNDNPFRDGAGPNNDYVWARGFRNPFTLTFQPGTGNLWVNTVGTLYEQIFVVNRGDHAGWNAYENNQPSGYLTPVIAYRTNGSDTNSIAANGAVRNNNVVTFTTTVAHGFRAGTPIAVSGVASSSFNGSFYVATAPSSITFTVSQPGPNQTSGGGSATTFDLGGCVTGGCFYDSTAFPAAYRGNFFFGDYNSGRIMRATLDVNNNVTSVDYFVSGVTQCVDITTGPDGALYYVGVGGFAVYRLAYVGTAQNLIVSPTALNMLEGGAGMFTVRLAAPPTGNVTVDLARTAGDSDLTVASGPTLTFTPANYATPQIVYVTAAEDPDTISDSATFTVSSTGLAAQTVNVNAVDNDGGLLLSTSVLNINEGGSGTFFVSLSDPPTATVSVNVVRSSGDPDITISSGASLTFTPADYSVPQAVSVSGATDPDTIDDTATITVSSAGLPAVNLAVTVQDNTSSAPVITSAPSTSAIVGAAYSYGVNAVGAPTPAYSLVNAPAGMTIDAANGLISWTPTQTGGFDVAVQAANGISPDALQSYTITVSPDAPPIAILTRPVGGEVVSGSTAEFFGDGHDDVATVRAEFYVDGVLSYTDINSNNHFHFGGSHNLWDTTQLTDGSHDLRFVVYDTTGQTGSATVSVMVSNLAGAPTPLVASYLPGTLRNDFNGWLGMKITVGASPITVTSLGRMFYAGNNSTHSLKVVFASNGADVPGGGTSLNMLGGTAGQFKYAPLSAPLTLAANTSYHVVSLEVSGGDRWATDNTQVTPTTAATCDGAILSKPGGWTFRFPANRTFGPVNLVYTTGSSPPPNAPPTVSLSSPANNAMFTAPANITLNANASDSDGTVAQVDFYVGTTWLGTDSTSPYSFAWNNVGAGVYGLTARVRDNAGTVNTSSVVNVTINQPPVVSLSNPANNATFTAPANITLTATATDSDGLVSKVDFFAGPSLLASAATSPYNFVWNNVLAGNYFLTATATDNLNASNTSVAVRVTVGPAGTSTPFVTGYVQGTLRNDFNGWLGMKFTVGPSPIIVTALGRIFIAGNVGTHTVKLVNASNGIDVIGGGASIAMAGGVAGQFTYVSLANAITLPANTAYYLVSLETAGGDRWATSNTTVTTTAAATCNGALLSNGASWTLRLPANTTFGPVSFRYQ